MKITRRFFASLLLIVAPLLLSVARTSGDNSKPAHYFAFIGSYTSKTDSKVIRVHANEIREAGRSTQGVRLLRLDADDSVAAAAVLQEESEEEKK